MWRDQRPTPSGTTQARRETSQFVQTATTSGPNRPAPHHSQGQPRDLHLMDAQAATPQDRSQDTPKMHQRWGRSSPDPRRTLRDSTPVRGGPTTYPLAIYHLPPAPLHGSHLPPLKRLRAKSKTQEVKRWGREESHSLPLRRSRAPPPPRGHLARARVPSGSRARRRARVALSLALL